MRILLVEDEERMAQALCEILRQENYEVDHCGDGMKGQYAIETGVYDVVILDVMLPGKNGFDITREVRKKGIRTPILMLTAKSDIDDKVTGLDCGADDYLTKPFMTKELLARIRALGRRNIHSPDGTLTFGDISLNPGASSLSSGENNVRLSEKELRILEYLISNQGQILTREQIALKVWGYDSDTEYNNVEVYISFVRKKLPKRRVIYEDFGELLFTHFGLSGPVILSASAHMRQMSPGRYRILLNLKPALTPEQLDTRLQRDLRENQNRDFLNTLGALLPRKLIPLVVQRSGIPPHQKCCEITRPLRQKLGETLRELTFTVRQFRPIEEAIVTAGGVSVKEVNPRTMESKKCTGLYFAGEVLDVDAYTGGFNLQIAFATGHLAAESWSNE